MGMGDNKRKVLLTLLLVGVMGSLAAFGTYSAFVATTTNSGNSFAEGSVAIQDDTSPATVLFNVTNAAPSVATSKCIRIRYLGTLASKVHMFIPSTANGDKFQITVERGDSMSASDLTNRTCTSFNSTSTPVNAVDLDTFAATYGSGVQGKPADAAWGQNDTVDYRITLVPKDDITPNAHTSTFSTGP